jgi:hypothetical protein
MRLAHGSPILLLLLLQLFLVKTTVRLAALGQTDAFALRVKELTPLYTSCWTKWGHPACTTLAGWSSTYGATTCPGMFYGSDLGNMRMGSFDVDACMAWCYATYTTALGGYLANDNTCYCKGSMVNPALRACTDGTGFYKGTHKTSHSRRNQKGKDDVCCVLQGAYLRPTARTPRPGTAPLLRLTL